MDNYTLVTEHWPEILEKIRNDHGLTKISYESWLKPLEIKSVDNSGITFFVPTGKMAVNVLNKKYTLAIKVAIAEITNLVLDIHYVTSEEEEVFPEIEDADFTAALERAHVNPKYSFDSFVVGSNNKFAHAASLAVAESPGEIYNPLYLYAGVGLGKTHLMYSIAQFIIRSNPKARVLYVTSEEFTNELIESIRNSNNSAMAAFREKYRTNIDVLLIDDIQFIIGKDATQEEFFHTFEALYIAKKQIIVSSDKPPKDLNILEERIRSRLEMGLIADISSPDYETRMAILKKKNEQEGYHIDDDILNYIATNIKSNIRELEGCLIRIHAKSKLEKRVITKDLADEIMQVYISPNQERSVTSEMIIETVAEHFNLSVSEIKSQKKDAKFTRPRQIAMYLCREMTEDALQTIAGLLNRKDHTTVISAHRKIEKELQTSAEMRNNVEAIRKKVSPGR